MKTTLDIDDAVAAELLRSRRKRGDLPALPSFHGGGALVDITDRDALYQAMEDASAMAVASAHSLKAES